MNKLSTPISIIALTGVIALFIMHLSKGSGEMESFETSDVVKAELSQQVGVVNLDTLVGIYERHKKLEAEFENSAQKSELKIKARQTEIEKDFEVYSRMAAKMTPQERQEAELDLQRIQQQFQMMSQSEQQKLMEMQRELTLSLKEDLNKAIDKVQKEKNLQLVITQEASGNVLFSSKSLDITQLVGKYLNEEYQKEKEGEKETDK